MTFWTMFLTYLVTFVVTELLRPKPEIENAKPASLGDFQVPTATEGRVIPIIWGRVKMSGPNVVWYGDLSAIPVTVKVKTGMFSSSKRQIIGYRYKIGLQMALCRGPMFATDFIYNIRNDDSYAWGEDAPTLDAPISPVDAGTGLSINQPEFFGGQGGGGGGGLVGDMVLYPGTETQAVSTYLVGKQVPLPAYVGTVYINWESGEVGLQPSLRPFEFDISRFPDGLDLATINPGDEIIDDGANPMNVIYECVNNSEWGFNIGPGNINVANLRTLAATLKTEGQGFAWIWDRRMDVKEVIKMIEQQVDGVLYQDPVTGIFDFQLIRDDYILGNLPVLDESNVSNITRFARPSWAATSNVVNAQYTDREKNYNTSYAVAHDNANIDIVKDTNAVEVKFPGCKTASLANQLAWREIRALSYPIAVGKLETDRSQYSVKPGDVRALSWPRLGIITLPIRVTKVGRGKILNNTITIDFTEDIFSSQPGAFADPELSKWTPPSDIALVPLDEILLEVPYRITNQLDTGINTTDLQVASIVVRTTSMDVGWNVFALEVDAPGPAGTPTDTDVIPPGDGNDFCPYGLLTAALDSGETNGFIDAVGFVIDAPVELDRLNNATNTQLENAQNVLLIDNEIMLFKTVVDNLNDTWTISNVYRGALDTVPANHLDNAPVYFFSYGIAVVNDAPNTDTTRNYKVRNQPYTPFDTLAFADTIILEITTTGRAAKAYPPRDVTINPLDPGGGNFPVSAGSPSGAAILGDLVLRWVGSDKFTQAFATAWSGPHVVEEAGATFTVIVIEDPLGAATEKSNVSGITADPTEVTSTVTDYADDAVSDTYSVEISTQLNGDSQIWTIGPFTLYGYGYKYDEKYGGESAGVIL